MEKTVPVIGNPSAPDYFSRNTTKILKAIAIIFLIAGHFYVFCIKGGNGILSLGGEWAVLIFLIVSAMGLCKSYGLDHCGKGFIYKRLARIIFPLWLSSGLFYSLDFFILHKTYPLSHIVSSFAGILQKAPPNSPAWFVSFIIYLYLMFFFVSYVPLPKFLKCIAIVFISVGTSVLIARVPLLSNSIGGWCTYSLAFPLSICIMAYGKVISHCLQWLYVRFLPGLIALGLALALLYFTMRSGKTIFFVGFIAVAVVFIDKLKSIPKSLAFLGDHSFELYLMHFPFGMENFRMKCSMSEGISSLLSRRGGRNIWIT